LLWSLLLLRRGFLVDEMDRAGLEGDRVNPGQRDFLSRLPKERHSAPQENRMNGQIVLVDQSSFGLVSLRSRESSVRLKRSILLSTP